MSYVASINYQGKRIGYLVIVVDIELPLKRVNMLDQLNSVWGDTKLMALENLDVRPAGQKRGMWGESGLLDGH